MEHKPEAITDGVSVLSAAQSGTLEALAMALDYRDQSTSGHSRRVANLTVNVALAYGVDGIALQQVEQGALLHDIGKLKIPDSILWKPTQLDDEEWLTMRRHPEFGYEMLRSLEFLDDAAQLVLSHHEKFDGTGYPRGLRGDGIPLGARIFSVVDAVDAMIYKRPYNAPITFKEAAVEIRRCAGTQFDPELVPLTIEVLEECVPKNLRG
jgi:putative nucleotidyltransferase with HDIG domain